MHEKEGMKNKMIKVCFAIGNPDVENWIKGKLGEYCEFVGQVTHREQIIETVKRTLPDVLVLDVLLPSSQTKGIDFDYLIEVMRTSYTDCRIVLIAGEQSAGNDFLRNMVGRGIYDIMVGNQIDAANVCEMILQPKDYKYASQFQALERLSDSKIGTERTRYVETVKEDVSMPVVETQPANNLIALAPVNHGEKRGKVITFTSARQGVGCTSVAINVAFSLAETNKRVLLIDAAFGMTSVFQRLDLPLEWYTMDQVLEFYAQGVNISRLPLNKTMVKNTDKYADFPVTLSFLRFSDYFAYWDTQLYLPYVIDYYKTQFDYIIIDSDMRLNYPIMNDIFNMSHTIGVVVSQDVYEVNMAHYYLKYYAEQIPIMSKVLPVVNKFIKRGEPDLETIRMSFRTNLICPLSMDTQGYMRAYCIGHAYYPQTKKKYKSEYWELLGQLL